jgi:hypothetical protein
MPYIKQESRPPYDAIANTMIAELVATQEISDSLIKHLTSVLSSQQFEDIDGCLNYFITKLFKSLALHKHPEESEVPCAPVVEDAMLKLFKDLYPQKYFHFNRAGGVLLWCRKEFERRCGKTYCSTILTNLADRLYKDPIGPYEDKKIAENGDV